MVGLSNHIEPRRLSRSSARLSGAVDAGRLERLQAAVEALLNDPFVELDFLLDDDGAPLIRGSVKSQVKLVCQRCLEPMDIELSAAINVKMVGASFPNSLSGEMVVERGDGSGQPDLIETEEDRLSTAWLVEEELLLALPDYPMHESEGCNRLVEKEPEPVDETAPQSPFAALEALKGQLGTAGLDEKE